MNTIVNGKIDFLEFVEWGWLGIQVLKRIMNFIKIRIDNFHQTRNCFFVYTTVGHQYQRNGNCFDLIGQLRIGGLLNHKRFGRWNQLGEVGENFICQ